MSTSIEENCLSNKSNDETEEGENEPKSVDIDDKDENKKKAEEDATLLVLEPDHPMMERFQVALKNHLLKQIDKLSGQIYELRYELMQDNEVKAKEKDKEETGLELYEAQQGIFRQQKVLEDCEKTIENLMKERETLDESVKNKKISWKEEVNQLNCAKKKEMDMIAELQKLFSVEKQMEKWGKEIESELTVSQRISEKTVQDKNKLIEEKRKMDMYLLKLMTTISNYESEMKVLEAELEIKIEDKNTLSQTLADASADLQALVADQKRLVAAWNSVASIINQRNSTYASLANELTKLQNSFRSLNTEIESYKRSSAEEMKKGEKLALTLGRFENERESSETILKNLMHKKDKLDEQISSTSAMIERTEAESLNLKCEKEKLEVYVVKLRNCYDKLCEEQRLYEDKTLQCHQEQLFNNKSSVHVNKMLKETREKNRKQEYALLETENKISQKFLEAEELKEIIYRNNEIITEMNAELKIKEEELKKLEEEIERCQTSVIQKHGNYAMLMRKIEKQMEKMSFGKGWMNPNEQRIIDLEKMNSEIQAKNEKMQSFWLIQQNINVKLTQQRSEQIKEISLLRKQVLLFEQKALKIEREFTAEKKIENDINKSIAQYQHKLICLNETLVGKKDYKENLGKENTLVQAQFVQNLKDSELEQIRLKDEIKELENNLEELTETMLATQREMLAWERKIQLAVEVKDDIQKQKSSSGEIGQMKTEIHRMEVRYGQLKKAQDKLISDLEQCVYRRDAIMDGADAKEKRQSKGVPHTKLMIQKKLENIRNNIRNLRNEQKQVQKLIETTKEGHEDLKKCIEEKENHLKEMNETSIKMDLELEDRKLQKIQNLETLIRRQKKCKLYEQLKNGKHRLLFKNESVLASELQKAKNKNANLVSIMEALIEDFPRYRFHLKKIYNTFDAKPS